MQAHPHENLDLRNGSKLFQTLQDDLNRFRLAQMSKKALEEKLKAAKSTIESLKENQGRLLSTRHKPSSTNAAADGVTSPVRDYLNFKEKKQEFLSEQFAIELERKEMQEQIET